MSSLPTAIYAVPQVRALDAAAIARIPVPGYTLMTRAAESALRTLRSEWPLTQRVIVICGAGNNAGDGYVLARLALAAGLQVVVLAVQAPDHLRGDAHQAWQDWLAAGGSVQAWQPELIQQAVDPHDVIVDALLGIGLSRPLSASWCDVVACVNAAVASVLALDVPSGLDADTGQVLGSAVRADVTLTFVGLKLGLYLGAGPDHVGKLLFDDLGIPTALADEQPCAAHRLDEELIRRALPRRRRTAHKGQHGHVVVIGGAPGMAGAVRLAGEACLRAGAGLVTVVTHPAHADALVMGRPELMVQGVTEPAALQRLLARADVIAIGPGLGQSDWARDLLQVVLSTSQPMVVDADALNLLARAPMQRDHWILTPHPGEAARLLSTSNAAIQADRLHAVQQLATQYGGVVVLKGAGTLVAQRDAVVSVCDRGNPGMAVPGMGDVLTGIIAAVLAQCGDLSLAARAGVLIHAKAGDMAARYGERGLLASDLFTHLPHCINP